MRANGDNRFYLRITNYWVYTWAACTPGLCAMFMYTKTDLPGRSRAKSPPLRCSSESSGYNLVRSIHNYVLHIGTSVRNPYGV